jgi:hypothetical protein
MPLNLDTTPRTLTHAKHLITAVAWTCLLLYSIYLLLDGIFGSRTPNILHLVMPIPLLLVSIRAIRRYMQIRSQVAP